MQRDLFWGHIGRGTHKGLFANEKSIVGSGRHAKITEQDIIVLPNEHVFWLDIMVNEPVAMGILQSASNLLDIVDNSRERNACSFRVMLPEHASGIIVHH